MTNYQCNALTHQGTYLHTGRMFKPDDTVVRPIAEDTIDRHAIASSRPTLPEPSADRRRQSGRRSAIRSDVVRS